MNNTIFCNPVLYYVIDGDGKYLPACYSFIQFLELSGKYKWVKFPCPVGFIYYLCDSEGCIVAKKVIYNL